jgi:hypothetical protein
MSRKWIMLVILAATMACGSDTPTTPTSDWIELNALTPPSGTTLTAGERVTFTATVTCTVVSSDGGTVGLVLMDQGNRNVGSTPQPFSTLPKGNKTVTLTDSITVPVSGSTVSLVLPLFVNGSTSTRALKKVDYSVR